MNDDNFDKYLKISNLSLIIKKIGDRIDFIEKNKIYENIDGCIRESNIDFILDQQKDFYFLDVEYFRGRNPLNNNYYPINYKLIESDMIKIKNFNQLSKSKIIIVGHFTIQKLYQLADFIIEYIDSKPKIIKNRYFPIYD